MSMDTRTGNAEAVGGATGLDPILCRLYLNCFKNRALRICRGVVGLYAGRDSV